MKHFKKLALAACAVLAFGFAACSSDDDSSSYTVTIASTIENGKVTADKTSAVAGETVKLTATPADGYTLDSFSVTDANTNAITVTNGAFTMPASNVTVSATFKQTTSGGGDTPTTTTYTVTVNEADNGTVTASPTSAAEGETVTLTATPSTGYQLATLTVQNGTADVTVTNNAFTMPAGNVTVSATFTALPPDTTTYTVRHLFQKTDASGYEQNASYPDETKSGTIGAETQAEAKTVTGFTAQSFTQATIAASGTTVEIKYDRDTYTVTFDADGGSEVTAQTVRYGATATKPENDPTKEATATASYTFAGWYNGDTEFDFATPITDDITLKAKWTETAVLTYIGTKAPSEAKAVGDIVFSDGSATPYTGDLTLTDDQKAKAIAVIFYVGTELNSDEAEGNADTTTSRTLGVGLAHNTSGLAWCKDSANAYNKNITTIQCPASGSAGALTFTGDKDGSDNLSQIGTFLASNGITDDTATEANYPAFYFAKNYASQEGSHVSGTDYASDWYLPTIAELFQIWKSKETVDAASQLCGGSEFGTDVYWSSSQYASTDLDAYYLGFFDGDWNYYYKYGVTYVCAVRAFN
ncbi:MAG: InlB B-repeat-containing protein [Treponema sp.]|nr:InlB B-repeat-containing protein [Treponema sp.]